jgi:inhibitor of KinA sporulation pathway (predicted exonuclease)
MDLTSIRQSDIDAAPAFPTALAAFRTWAREFAPYTFASWGAYDRNQFRRDCERHRIPYPFINHVNLKQMFADVFHCSPCGMPTALSLCGLPLEGTHHRGIDDVRNIARILERMIARVGVETILGVP